MPISNRSGFRHCSKNVDVTSRTAVYGPVRTVVWQGSAGDRRPYADQTGLGEVCGFRRIAVQEIMPDYCCKTCLPAVNPR